MLFWIIALILTGLVSAILLTAMTRPILAEPGAEDISVYRDQLREVERDLTRGVLTETEADVIRTEISRRILSADAGRRAIPGTGFEPLAHRQVLVVVAVLFALSFGAYWMLGAPGYRDLPQGPRLQAINDTASARPGQETAERQAAVPSAEDQADPDYLGLVERLRDALETRPESSEGFERLARAEANLGNFVAARRAQANLIGIKGETATAEDWAIYAELLIIAAGGYVSPEAQVALNRALDIDAGNPAARYYFGLMFSQTGRPDRAFHIWRGLLEESTGDEVWVDPIRQQIEVTAQRAGLNYQLPTGEGGDQAAMIRGMVAGLAQRLANEGGTPEEWARLIRAYGVLDQRDNARAVWTEAQEVFGDNPAALDIIRPEAEEAGVAQ